MRDIVMPSTHQLQALSQTPSEQLPLNATEKLGFAQSGSENQLPKEVGVSEDKPRKARTTKRASRKDQGTTGQQLQLVPSSVGSSTGQPLLQRPPPRDATLHDNESPNELDDGGGKPRKRRRVSPKPDGDWARSNDRAVQANSRQARQESTHNDHGVVIEPLNLSLEEQLIFAGYSNSSPQKPASIQAQEIQGTMTDELAAGGKAQPSAPSEAPRTPSKRSKVSSTNLTPTKRSPRSAKPIPQKTTPTSKQEKEGQQVSPSKTNTNTPPKKLLKLRNDGKLSSPKRAPTDGVKRQGRMKKSEGGPGDPKEKLVRISYGVDTDSRQAFGQKIESVFSGATPIRTEPKPQAKQSEPPKITHPFFMRKDVKLASATPVIDLEAAKDSAPGTSPKTSPRKKQPATSSWAGFGSSFLKPIKYPGAIEPLWPPQNMLHRRGIPEYHSPEDTLERTQIDQRKFKAAEVRVRSKDEVLRPYQQLVQFCRDTSSSHSYFHRPTRRLLTGPELQGLTKERARSRLPSPDQAIISAQSSLEGVRSDHKVEPATQRVIIDLHSRISTSLSAFDKFECDSQDWAHKYSPKCAVDVLQESNDLLLLRDWLLNFTVNSVDSGKPGSNAQLSAELARKMRMKAKRKRRLQGELSDFLVTVDEGGYNDDLTDPEDLPSETAAASLHRLTASSLYSTKAVVISGPHGCGKTASAYAVAQELGFEIFEINSGTRRSGKDILDKVGDMTRNHLVQQKSGVSDTAEPKEDDFGEVQAEVDSGRQSTMGAFFKSSSKAKPQSKPKKVKKKQAESPKKPRNQRQSVILLEEVDVLFEEDKLFWSTVLTLLVNSRRPIVMTCVDESLLPREEMLNCRALRLSSPSPELAADYLLMMAGNEGHLLSLESLEALYQSQRRDLRASIAHLQFHCQMALGDEKGGLEWMLIRSSQQECHNEKGEQLRVVSDRTFTDYMGVLPDSHEAPSVSELDSDVAVLLEAARDWGYDVGNWNDFVGLSSDLQSSASGNASLETLVSFDLGCDALSAADLLPVSGYFEPCTVRDTTGYMIEHLLTT